VKAEKSDSYTCYGGRQMKEKYCCLVPSPVSSCHLDRHIGNRGGGGDKILDEPFFFFKTTQISIIYFFFLCLK